MFPDKPNHYERIGVYCATINGCILAALVLVSIGLWESGGRFEQGQNTVTIVLIGFPLYVAAFFSFLVLILFSCRLRFYVLTLTPAFIWFSLTWFTIRLLSTINI